MAGGAVWLAEFWDRRQQRYPSGKDPFLVWAPPGLVGRGCTVGPEPGFLGRASGRGPGTLPRAAVRAAPQNVCVKRQQA